MLRAKRAIDDKEKELQKQNGSEKKKEYLPHAPKKGLDIIIKANAMWKHGGFITSNAKDIIKQVTQYRQIPYRYGKHTGGLTMSNFAWSASQHKKIRMRIKNAYESAKNNNDFWLALTFDLKDEACFGEPTETYQLINEEMNNLMHLLRNTLAPYAILVLESHSNGLPHFHAAFGISKERSKVKTYDSSTVEGVIFYIEKTLEKNTQLQLSYAKEMEGEAYIEYLQKQFKYDIDKLDSAQKRNDGILPQELTNYLQAWVWSSKANIRRVRIPRNVGADKTSATKTQKIVTPHGIVLMPDEQKLSDKELLQERTKLIQAFTPCLANIENAHCDGCCWGMWIKNVVYPFKEGSDWIPYNEFVKMCEINRIFSPYSDEEIATGQMHSYDEYEELSEKPDFSIFGDD